MHRNRLLPLAVAASFLSGGERALAQQEFVVNTRLVRNGFDLRPDKSAFTVPQGMMASAFRVLQGDHNGFSIYSLDANGNEVDFYATRKVPTDWNATLQRFASFRVVEQPGPLATLTLGPGEYYVFPAGGEGAWVSVSYQLRASAAAPAQRLAIFAVPNPVLAQTSDENLFVVVQLLDAAGNPARTTALGSAPLVVTLTSSNAAVLRPYGADGNRIRLETANAPNFGFGRFVSPASGTATITATAPGFSPASVTVNAVAQGGPAASLRIYATPPTSFAADRVLFYAQLLDAQGRPAKPKRSFTATVQSSAPAVVELSKELFFYDSFSAMQLSGSARSQAGTATLAIAASGLTGDSTRLTTIAAPPLAAATPTPPLGPGATVTVQARLTRVEAVVRPEKNNFTVPPGKTAVAFRVLPGNHRGFSIYSLTPNGDQQERYKTFEAPTNWNATLGRFMSSEVREQPVTLGNLALGPGEYFVFPAGGEGAQVTLTLSLVP